MSGARPASAFAPPPGAPPPMQQARGSSAGSDGPWAVPYAAAGPTDAGREHFVGYADYGTGGGGGGGGGGSGGGAGSVLYQQQLYQPPPQQYMNPPPQSSLLTQAQFGFAPPQLLQPAFAQPGAGADLGPGAPQEFTRGAIGGGVGGGDGDFEADDGSSAPG
jgi:hypothetical protein